MDNQREVSSGGRMKIAMIASEMEPYATTGGLGEVMGSLPLALGGQGLEVRIYLPRYGFVSAPEDELRLDSNVTVHFVRQEHYFDRSELYGGPQGDYPDNAARFCWFSRQAVKKMKQDGFKPDWIHVHDWQGAGAVLQLKAEREQDPYFAQTNSMLTIHNLAYGGHFKLDQFSQLGFRQEDFQALGFDFYGKGSLLKAGLLNADQLTTVSSVYAQEIQTESGGAGLEKILQARKADLSGILNGIDLARWNPKTDREVSFRYDSESLNLRSQNKPALQQAFGLPKDPEAFLVGMVTRLDYQKGLDLVLEAVPQLLTQPIQLVLLGFGDRDLADRLVQAAHQAPDRVAVRILFDEGLARKVYAGVDALLIPSRYEPCGLTQMAAMRYGAVPIARSTGGLKDTVTKDRGFLFELFEASELLAAVAQAQDCFRETPDRWHQLQAHGMEADFSWDEPARKYAQLYAGRQSSSDSGMNPRPMQEK